MIPEIFDVASAAAELLKPLILAIGLPSTSTLCLILGLASTVLLSWRAASIIEGTLIGAAGGTLVPLLVLLIEGVEHLFWLYWLFLIVGPVLGGASGSIASVHSVYRNDDGGRSL